MSRSTLDVDTDGNGSTDLVDAELDMIALSSSGMGVVVDGVADLTVSGDLGLARISVGKHGALHRFNFGRCSGDDQCRIRRTLV